MEKYISNNDKNYTFQPNLYENYSEGIKNKVLGLVGSHFLGFSNKIIYDNKGNKLVCNFSKSWDDIITFSLKDKNNKVKSYIKFVDFEGYYSIDNIESYERGYGSFILDFFLENIGNHGVFLTSNASLKGSNDGKGNEIKLSNFYKKRGFEEAGNDILKKYDVILRGNIDEEKILDNWF